MNFSLKLFERLTHISFLFSHFSDRPTMATPCMPRPKWFTDDIKAAVDSARAHPFG